MGGRIPAAAANIGGKLDVKPELTYDSTGALIKTVCRGAVRNFKSLIQMDFRAAILTSFLLALISADGTEGRHWPEAQIQREGCEDSPLFIAR